MNIKIVNALQLPPSEVVTSEIGHCHLVLVSYLETVVILKWSHDTNLHGSYSQSHRFHSQSWHSPFGPPSLPDGVLLSLLHVRVRGQPWRGGLFCCIRSILASSFRLHSLFLWLLGSLPIPKYIWKHLWGHLHWSCRAKKKCRREKMWWS